MSSTPESAEIVFEEGLIGVPRARRFELLERPGSEVRLLRCLDIEGFALSVIDPFKVDPNYSPRFGPQVAARLACEKDDPILLLATATRHEDGNVDANLRAPLVINTTRCLGVQIILDDPSLSLNMPVRKAG